MAIIKCPGCGNRISDKAKTCGHCHYDLVTSTTATGVSEEALQSKAKLAHIKKRYSLQMQAMAAIILFLLGILLWYFLGNQGFSQPSHFIELGMAAVGGLWYLLTRVRLLLFKKGE